MSQVVIDAIDRKILKYLITNARMPFLEIARKCGISGAAIHQRIKKLDESGVILGSRLVVDPKMLGFDVCACRTCRSSCRRSTGSNRFPKSWSAISSRGRTTFS